MNVAKIFLPALLLALGATAARADIVIGTTGHLEYVAESNLSKIDLNLSLANVNAVAIGDVITTTGSPQIVLARGSLLEIRDPTGATVLMSRNFSPETINDIAIGLCRPDLPGLDIAVATVNHGTTPPSTDAGYLHVLNANTGTLNDQNYLSYYYDITACAIANVDTKYTGGQVVLCTQYTLTGASTDTQIAVFECATANSSIDMDVECNVYGVIPPSDLAVDYVTTTSYPQILAGTANTGGGSLYLLDASLRNASNSLLLVNAQSNPYSTRSNLTSVQSVALGALKPGSTLKQPVVYSTDMPGGVIRVIDPSINNGLMTQLAAKSNLFGSDVVSMYCHNAASLGLSNDQIYVAQPGGTVTILNNALTQLSAQSGFGTINAITPSSGVIYVAPPPTPTPVPKSADLSLF